MKKKIVVSAINIFQGGALSILNDCLSCLINHFSDRYEIVAFVHDKSFFDLNKLTIIELPNSRKSYLFRLYYEYVWFYFQSKKIKPYLWFSLHDMTPNVNADIRAVYCHNPSPFYKISWREFCIEPKFGFFNAFYRYLYKINTNKNDFIVVQQNWLRDEFRKNLNKVSKIVVAKPNIEIPVMNEISDLATTYKKLFFFPTFPRVFKNIECACEAAKILSRKGYEFELCITISGKENIYAKHLLKRYGNVRNIIFVGTIKREQVFEVLNRSIALVFPSKLETWGLPISEAKMLDKPIIVSDLPYAHETIGDYSRVSFFNPGNSLQLADLMEKILVENKQFDGNVMNNIVEPYAKDWCEIFNILLKKDIHA